MKAIAITGASGGGKSTILRKLGSRGFVIQEEIGRLIVKEELKVDGNALPWKDKIAFRDKLFEKSCDVYKTHAANQSGLVFFDRTFIEAIAYSAIIKEETPKRMLDTLPIYRFYDLVFVCPPWQEIYVTDAERKHDFDFAMSEYEANITAYKNAGYELLEVPFGTVEARCDFVLRKLN